MAVFVKNIAINICEHCQYLYSCVCILLMFVSMLVIANNTGGYMISVYLLSLSVSLINISKYSITSYVGIGQVQNGILYLSYRSDFAITKAERCKAFTQKNLHYSIVGSAPRILLTFSKSRKLSIKISVLFFFFIFLSFSSCIPQKL